MAPLQVWEPAGCLSEEDWRIGKARDCPTACRCCVARSTAGTSEPAAWEAQDAGETARDGAAVQVSFRNNMPACHIPGLYRRCCWRAGGRAIPGCWQRGKVMPSPVSQPGVGRAEGWEVSPGRRRPSRGDMERLCSPSCLTLPKMVQVSIAFPQVLHSTRAVHPSWLNGSHRQLVPGPEPSLRAAATQHPPQHLPPTLGLFQQGSSSVLLQPCIANQLLENKKPSCFFGLGCDKSGH